MNERAPLLELLRLLVAACLIDGKVFVRDHDGVPEVQVHEQRSACESSRAAVIW
jgi:hypothetical protein